MAHSNSELFHRAVEYVSDSIVITDPDGVIMYSNKAAEKMTGYTFDEMVGSTPALWSNQVADGTYDKSWEKIKSEGEPRVIEVVNKRKDGRVYDTEVRISPISDDAGNIQFFVRIEVDITKKKEVDRIKNEFISIASHQLRTPMTGIKWVVERFIKKEKLSAKGVQYLRDIQTSTHRLSQFIDLLLNASRVEGGKIGIVPRPVELIQFIRSYIIESTPLIESRGLRVIFENHPSELVIKTDIGALRNIIQSLVSNSIEYTPKGGEVEISVEMQEHGIVQVKVRDTGIGIPLDSQEHIFNKFTRAENAKLVKTDGTGLGLFIVKQAVELLGGEVSFVSEENYGTTFTVNIPIESLPREGEKKFA